MGALLSFLRHGHGRPALGINPRRTTSSLTSDLESDLQ